MSIEFRSTIPVDVSNYYFFFFLKNTGFKFQILFYIYIILKKRSKLVFDGVLMFFVFLMNFSIGKLNLTSVEYQLRKIRSVVFLLHEVEMINITGFWNFINWPYFLHCIMIKLPKYIFLSSDSRMREIWFGTQDSRKSTCDWV